MIRDTAGFVLRGPKSKCEFSIPDGPGGKETLVRLRELDPGVRAIVSSGYSNDTVMAEYRKHGFAGVIAKPYRIEDLDEMLRKVLEG